PEGSPCNLQKSLSKKDFEDYRESLLELKLYKHELVRKYGEGDQMIAEVRQQIEMIRNILCGNTVSSAKNTAMEKDCKLDAMADQIVLVKAAYSRQQEKVGFTQRELRGLEGKSQRIAEQQGVLHELRLEAEKTRAKYEEYVQEVEKGQEAHTSSDSVTVVEKPMLPIKPVKPKKFRNIFLAIIFGLLCCLLYAFVRKTWSERSVKA
ncbi:MAG: hypothetical protein D3924_09055, partial [Candidatus Electrothrix sp. AR4]|nr:hypothetical protein [Candidatus Electrothrix sp. AR4]